MEVLAVAEAVGLPHRLKSVRVKGATGLVPARLQRATGTGQPVYAPQGKLDAPTRVHELMCGSVARPRLFAGKIRIMAVYADQRQRVRGERCPPRYRP